MSDREIPIKELAALIDQLHNGSLDEDGMARLKAIVCGSPEAGRYYVEYMQLIASLRWHHESADGAPSDDLEVLASVVPDNPAPAAVSRPTAEAATVPLWKQPSVRAFAATFVIAATVIFSMLAYMQAMWDSPREAYHPPQPDRPIAALIETHDAVWENSPLDTRVGADLTAGRLRLRAGLAKVKFFGGATVILQGPAELELRTADSGYLRHGRLSAFAPEGAEGFRIDADGLRVIDLGTEFGLDLPAIGDRQVHVFKGAVEAALVDGNGQVMDQIVLQQNQAAQLDAKRVSIVNVAVDNARFVRDMPLKPYDLDLADIVANGDGRGSGNMLGINPTNGRAEDSPGLGNLEGDHAYHAVVLSPYIDGVFIPHGQPGPNRIDSAGHLFQFPDTSNRGWDLIRCGGTQDANIRGATNLPPVLDGVDYRDAPHSVIGLHANAGITFDLDALRRDHEGMRLTGFSAVAGNIGQKGNGKGLADVWVLVDGRVRFQRMKIGVDGKGVAIDLPLRPTDRFLTLVSTDAGNGIGLDWIILGDPQVHLMPAERDQGKP